MNRDLAARDNGRMMEQALTLLHEGRIDEAIDACRQVLDGEPDNPDALHFMGVAHLQKGDPGTAIALLEQAVGTAPEDADLRNNLGEALRAAGRNPEALAEYRRASAIEPDNPGFLYNLGSALHQGGESQAAVEALRRVTQIEPEFAGAWNNLGLALMESGQPGEAAPCFREAARLAPEDTGILANLGNSLQALGRADEAEQAWRRLIDIDDTKPEPCWQVGRLLRQRRDFAEAGRFFERAWELAPEVNRYRLEYGRVLVDMGALGPGEQLLRQVLADQPGNPRVLSLLGVCAQNRGDSDAAEALLREATDGARPDANALYRLAAMRREDGDHLGLIEQALADESRDGDEIADLHFAAGTLLDRADEIDRAFDHFRTGNEIRGRGSGFDPGELASQLAAIRASFTPELMDERSGQGNDSELPVFIVGLPRSGTTLVEQILASHPRVTGAGELPDIPMAANSLSALAGGGSGWPEGFADVDPRAFGVLANAYCGHLRELSATADRIVDKTPGNLEFVGLLALCFPKARIIHCRRDPRDVAISIYTTNFSENLGYAYRLEDIAAFQNYCDGLAEWWERILPGRMLEVRYEDLVADLATGARRLVGHCGLEWDDRCLEFHRTERQVATASSWQVRQPLYTTSVGRWRRYGEHLAPVPEAPGAGPGGQD